jgi:beta-N-acetylhexosaminidase
MRYFTTKLLIFILFVLAGLSAYNYFKRPFWSNFQETQSASSVPIPTPTPTVAKKELIDREKVAQLLAVAVDVEVMTSEATASARMLRFIKDYRPGMVVYFGEQISTESAALVTTKIYDQFSEQDYMPLIAVDHEGGLVQRLSGDGFTKLDSWQKIVSSYSIAQQKAVLNQSAKELYQSGINIVFGPVVDLASGSAVLKSRAAADLEQTVTAASNYIYAFSQYGIMPVLKHFPGIGSLKQDPHFSVSSMTPSKTDTVVFSRLLDTFSNIGLMTTHVRIQDKFNNQVCSLTAECVGKLGEIYPKVLLITDDLAMKAALSQPGTNQPKSLEQVAVEAVQAGNHVLVFGPGVTAEGLEKVTYTLQEQYQDSASFKAKVDTALAKILELKK